MDPTLTQLLTGGFDQRFNDAYADPAIALQLQQQALPQPVPLPPTAPVVPGVGSEGGFPWSPGSAAPTTSMAADMPGAAGFYGGSPAINPNLMPSGTPPAPTGGNAAGMLNALRGVQAAAAPTAQKVATPNAPVQRPIQGGELVNMLAAMGLGPRDVWTPPRIRTGGG